METSAAVHLLSIGPFGKAVTRHVKAQRNDVYETQVIANNIPLPQTWPKARLTVIASWRPIPALCELVDELSFEWRKPFLPVMLDSNIFRIGPLIVPGHGTCWRCSAQRLRQHEPWLKEHLALTKHYTDHPGSGPQGYLEAFAVMGATKIITATQRLDSSSAIPGHVWEIDVLTREIIISQAIGVHDCQRCGLQRPAQHRSILELRNKIAYLWASDFQEMQ